MANTGKLSVNSYRGTRDFYPLDMQVRNWIFKAMRDVAESFGYEEYDGPMLESYDLYAAKSGEELVNEQLYHFIDRGERHVAIRPEMTPTVARMVAARINQLPRPIRWFSFPNLWRYEKPQRGRLREHWQFNVDILGSDSIAADQEIIEIAIRVMFRLGAEKKDFQIRISNRKLLNFFLNSILKVPETHWSGICRTIDKMAKIPSDAFMEMLTSQGLTANQIDALHDYLTLTERTIHSHPVSQSPDYLEMMQIWDGLSSSGVDDVCCLDMSIVRGLDYYTGTVFEMYDLAPENRRALFGGGRYDNLVGLFCKERVSGVGFGMGDVTVRDFVETHGLLPELPQPVHVHIALFEENMRASVSALAIKLRAAGIRTTIQLDPAKLARQFKWADSKGIPIVLLQGPDELSRGEIQIKHMPSRTQLTASDDNVVQHITALLFGS